MILGGVGLSAKAAPRRRTPKIVGGAGRDYTAGDEDEEAVG